MLWRRYFSLLLFILLDAISECKERLHITGLNVYVSLFQSLENYEDSFLSLCYSVYDSVLPSFLVCCSNDAHNLTILLHSPCH